MEARAANENWTNEKFQSEWAKKEAEIKEPYRYDHFPGATKRAGNIEKTIADNFQPIGDNWFLTRESEDGLFVMARKIEGRVGQADPKDRWVLFKTDTPGKFATKAQTISNADIARERWIVGQNTIEANARPGTLGGALADLQKVLNFQSYADASKTAGASPSRMKTYLDKVMPEALRGNYSTQLMKQLYNNYFVPAAQQLGRSTRGRFLLGQGRMMQGMVDTFAERLLRGEAKLKEGTKSLIAQPFRREGGLEFKGGGATGVLDKAQAAGVYDELMGFVRKGVGPVEANVLAKQGKATQAAANLARELDESTKPMFQAMNQLQLMAGETPTRSHRAHYGFERGWEGDHFHSNPG
jgi:hypothetical protein